MLMTRYLTYCPAGQFCLRCLHRALQGSIREGEAMRFGLFYELQLPKPWNEGDEERIIRETIEQIEFADKLGFDSVWEVEHHFLEEYSHSPAPEVILGAAAARTKNIRLGHGITLLPPKYNHPARVAERIATLDLLSGGRVQFGTGESSSEMELGGFGVERADKKAMWREALGQIVRMMVDEPYEGFEGEYFSMPARNVVPKPKQKPHPPLWVACSMRETVFLAARLGIGALGFDFVDTAESKARVDEYWRIIRDECEPIGEFVNPQLAQVSPFMCHPDDEVAVERGLDGSRFFMYALAHYYGGPPHQPGKADIWKEYKSLDASAIDAMRAARQQARTGYAPDGDDVMRGCVGSPDYIRNRLRKIEAVGVDEVIFLSQAGNNKHEHIMESMELFAKEVMPEFKDREPEHQAWRQEQMKGKVLAPA
ncbi:MAG: LLM class flavin-dependent oxidoreductase [Dehalococcoidia bacterium]|nr:LLM class flavin-dependent oxidoreductase [Dehalococcoidia bacterium]